MMESWLHWLPLLNVVAIPGVLVLWRAARAVERVEAFMQESKADRVKLHAQVDAMEREMLRKGLFDAS